MLFVLSSKSVAVESPCQAMPCQNGATCFEGFGLEGNNFFCFCVAGYEGIYCENEVVNPTACSSLPCQNGATCTETLDGYQCTCADGWKGFNCEQGKLDHHVAMKQGCQLLRIAWREKSKN